MLPPFYSDATTIERPCNQARQRQLPNRYVLFFVSSTKISPSWSNSDVQFAPRGGAIAAGRKLLENFLEGIESQTSITGSTDSTPIGSLKSALSQISLSPVKIPALHDTLIKSASLSFPLDIVTTGIARTSFVLANPFTASINLLRVGAVAKYHDLTLGTIESVDTSSNPIHADGHSSVTSPQLPMKFNLDPVTIIRFLSIAAQERGVNLGPLVALFQFVLEHPTYHPPVRWHYLPISALPHLEFRLLPMSIPKHQLVSGLSAYH